MEWYYYLDVYGNIIGRNPYVTDSNPEYFSSSDVIRVWLTDSDSRITLWQVALEALSLGAQISSVIVFAKQNGLDYEDSFQMVRNTNPTDSAFAGFSIFIEEILETDWDTYWIEAGKRFEINEKLYRIRKRIERNKNKVESEKKDNSKWN